MLKARIREGLLGLGLLGVVALPAAAQSWPSDSGPSGDYLGSTMRQFDRLSPPPIESTDRAERPVPGMSITDVPGGSVDVGMPVATSSLPPPSASSRRSARRSAQQRRPVRAASSSPRRSSSDWEAVLARELAQRDREIQELRQRLDDQQRGPRGAAAVTSR